MNTIWLEASAGTGKTTFLISKLNEQENKENALFLTFSKTAANEIKERTSQQIKAYTIHALAYEIISNKFPIKNITQNSLTNKAIIELLKNVEYKNLLKWIIEVSDGKVEKTKVTKSPKISISYAPEKTVEFLILEGDKLIEEEQLKIIKNYFFTKAGTLRKKYLININEKLCEWAIARIQVHEKYYNDYIAWIKNKLYEILKNKEEELKQKNNILYYDDLIELAKQILKEEENGNLIFKYFGNIKLLLIDEAQDISKAQWELIEIILDEWKQLNANLIIASDVKQLIYEFQGANKKIFQEYKNKIKIYSNNFQIKTLTQTWRLPKKTCNYVNNIFKTMPNFLKHTTYNNHEGDIAFLKINSVDEIKNYILKNNLYNSETMILFKQKTKRMEALAKCLINSGIILNSPYITLHPILKDFAHLLNWLLFKDQLSLGVILNIFNKQEKSQSLNEMHKYLYNLEVLCYEWLTNKTVQKFLKSKLENQFSYWAQVLIEYSKFYKYNPYCAIYDNNNFYKNNVEKFEKGMFFNTIHSAKGMEAENVILCETDFKSKFKNDTQELLYVALTRTKKNLIIPILNEHFQNTWATELIKTNLY